MSDLVVGLFGAMAERELQGIEMKKAADLAAIETRRDAQLSSLTMESVEKSALMLADEEAARANMTQLEKDKEDYNKKQLAAELDYKKKQDAINVAAEIKKRKVEQDTAIESAKIKRRQAILEKTNSLAQIAINTALAVMKTWGNLGFPAGLIASALPLAAGVIAAATVAAQPLPEIPKFAKGTKSSPEGVAWVGERGTELGILPSGEAFLTPNKATLTYLPKGTEIVPNDVIKNDLQQINAWNMIPNTAWNGDARIGELIETIKNKNEVHVNIDKRGFSISEKQHRNRIEMLTNKYRK
jgi:hypothetical protein